MNATTFATAETALRTIRTRCGVDAAGFGGDRTALVRQSGQLALVVALAVSTTASVALDAFVLAGVDRIIGEDEIRAEIVAPLTRRGFCRIVDGRITATAAFVLHSNPVDALVAGESLAKTPAVKTVRASMVRPGDYVVGVGRATSGATTDTYGERVSVDRDGHNHETHLHGFVTVARAA